MADPNLIYDPPEGHNNTTIFPVNPAKETVRGLMQRLHDQTRDFINNTLILWIKSTFATKSEVNTIVLGQIVDGSLTDDKLSNDTGQIKDTVNTHLDDTTKHLTVYNQSKIDRAYSASKLYAYKNIGGAL